MEQAYAQALWESIDGGMAPHKAVHALRETLRAHGREALAHRIARSFERIAQREAKRSGITVTVAREKDAHKAHAEAKKFLGTVGLDAKDLKTEVDENVIGGWRVEGQEVLLDTTYKKQLLDMYNRVTKTF